MFYYLIPPIIIVASLLIVIFIIIKKLPKLSAINVESITEEKESRVRNRIMLERLTRKFLDFKKLLKSILGPLKDKLISIFSDFYKKIHEIEKKAAQQARPLSSVDTKQETKEILQEADQLLGQDKLTEAEEVYIKIISLDSKNSAAYNGLAKVYFQNHDYKKAKETLRYCLKLLTKSSKIDTNEKKHELACCYADLGSIYQAEGKSQLALNNFQKAVEIEPHNPRFLDFLLKISIILENKELALKTFNTLKKADPDNQKLKEIKKEIDNLPS